jgi:hypothetical protein
MANQYDDDLDDDLDIEDEPNQQVDPNGPANLRKALKREQREKKQLSEQLAQIQAELRSRSVKEVLEQKGVPNKVAKFIPGDVNTPEQIDAWLNENADVFGFQPKNAEPAQTEEQLANQRSYERINATTQNANTPSRDQDVAARLAGAKSIEELNAITGLPNQRFRG